MYGFLTLSRYPQNGHPHEGAEPAGTHLNKVHAPRSTPQHLSTLLASSQRLPTATPRSRGLGSSAGLHSTGAPPHATRPCQSSVLLAHSLRDPRPEGASHVYTYIHMHACRRWVGVAVYIPTHRIYSACGGRLVGRERSGGLIFARACIGQCQPVLARGVCSGSGLGVRIRIGARVRVRVRVTARVRVRAKVGVLIRF